MTFPELQIPIPKSLGDHVRPFAGHRQHGVEHIDADCSILEAAEKFLHSNYRRFPVLREGRLVGQISRKDIVIAALKLSGENWK